MNTRTRPCHRLASAAARSAACALLAAMLASCGLLNMGPLRTVEVKQPPRVRPADDVVSAPANGSIYASTTYSHLFEDRRARRVGDMLTININEQISASKKASTTASRGGTTSFSVPVVTGLPGKSFQGAALSADSANDFAGKGDSGANNIFTGSITVIVSEVLPNGHLVVSGEKQIGINQGSEFVRVSGIVNPDTIQFGNIVSSTRVADARLEYRGTGYIDEAQTMGWLARVFQSILPF